MDVYKCRPPPSITRGGGLNDGEIVVEDILKTFAEEILVHEANNKP